MNGGGTGSGTESGTDDAEGSGGTTVASATGGTEATDASASVGSADSTGTGTAGQDDTVTSEATADTSASVDGSESTESTVLPFDCDDPDLPVTVEGEGSYATISAAVAAAAPGATVQICPGTYEESFTIIRDLELAGAGMDLVEIVGDVNTTVAVNGAYLHGHDFTIRGGEIGLSSGSVSSVDDGDILLLERVAIEGAAEFGVHVSDLSGGTHPIRLESCRITGTDAADQGAGLYLRRTEGVVVDTEISLNTAEEGGGIILASSSLQFEGGHVHQNEASMGGGALLTIDLANVFSRLVIVDSNWASGQGDDNVETDVRCIINSSIASDVAGFLGENSNAICEGDTAVGAPACCLTP